MIKKNILKSRLHLASIFHYDGTIWCNGENFIELINNQNIKIRIIIPIEKSNVPKGTLINFYFNYNLKNLSLKGNDIEYISIIYYQETKILKLMGMSEIKTEAEINSIKNSVSFSDKISKNDPFSDCLENNVKISNNVEKINTDLQIKFTDIYDLNNKYIYNSINIEKYNNKIGYFIIPYSKFITYLTKILVSKINNVEFKVTGDNISLTMINNLSLITNILNINYFKLYNKIDNIVFNISVKNLEPIKNINISINDKDKNTKIYNNLLFEVVYYNNKIIGLNLKPTINFNDIFIFIPIID